MQHICVPIFVHDSATALAAMRQAVADGATLVELRCDTTPLPLIHEALRLKSTLALPDGSPLPAIVTIRPTWEGGHFDGDDQNRISLFEHAGLAGADFIDVELAAWKRSANLRQKIMLVCAHPAGKDDGPRPRTCKLILSNHSFDGRPADLENRIAELRSIEQASILKIAWKAQNIRCGIDALRLMRQQHDRHDGRPLLALAMHEPGLISRVLSGKFFAPLTFGTTTLAPGSAPGQPTARDLSTMYRWTSQRPGQPTYAVIGHPVGHSLSPAIHNAGLAALGLEGTYVPLLIEPNYEAFRDTVNALRETPGMYLRGLSVTIPHKENAMRYARENAAAIDELSRHIGVVNTLSWNDAGRLQATNSDYAGSVDALAAALSSAVPPARESLAGKRVAILGAGGAARAIVAALANYGATTVIYNRTTEKAAALAAEFNATGQRAGKVLAMPLSALPKSCCDIVINCTPLGMVPHTNASPIDFDPDWNQNTVVFDTIYNPLMTNLLKTAQSKNAHLITGVEMFVRQAAVQFEMFTGKAAPVEIFRRAMSERLVSV